MPFLTLPTSCTGPEKFSASINQRAEGSVFAETAFVSHDANDLPQGLSGCDRLNFGPTISVAPDTSYADTPAGLTVEVKAVQETLNNEAGIATSNIKDTTVTLPEGVAINPGQAAGLGACRFRKRSRHAGSAVLPKRFEGGHRRNRNATSGPRFEGQRVRAAVRSAELEAVGCCFG